MGGKPSTTHVSLPNNYGWVANEFKEYDAGKNRIINIYKSLDRLKKGGNGTVYKVHPS